MITKCIDKLRRLKIESREIECHINDWYERDRYKKEWGARDEKKTKKEKNAEDGEENEMKDAKEEMKEAQKV